MHPTKRSRDVPKWKRLFGFDLKVKHTERETYDKNIDLSLSNTFQLTIAW